MKIAVGIALCLLAVCVSNSAGQVCCPEIGCISQEAPYNQLPPPECPKNVQFKMFTRTNPSGESFTTSTVPYSYNGARRTIIIAHALSEGPNWPYINEMREAFLAKEDVNVVVVDWTGNSNTLIIPIGVSRARGVSMVIVKAIQNLLRQPYGDSRRFWCVGFCTAAHLCGHVGMNMPVGQKLGRVTGISPDGPGIDDIADTRVGINPSAALFVDVLHSDSSYIFGTKRRLGHQDSYYTGHEFSLNLSIKNWLNLQAPVCEPYCQFRYAINFFISSIKQESQCFATANHCASESSIPGSCQPNFGCWAYSGYYADRSCRTTGLIHLKISTSDPYCAV